MKKVAQTFKLTHVEGATAGPLAIIFMILMTYSIVWNLMSMG